MKANCGCGGPCCDEKKLKSHRLIANLDQTAVRYETLDGKACIVVPVVMARAGVVMNGSLTILDELDPNAWNGRPVTVGHPETPEGEFQTASAPDVVPEWCVGQLFNAKVEDDALKAEAWIDIGKARKVRPGLIATIKSGEPLDVSTGFFADDEEATGVSNGREYQVISRNWRPDHLALLPDEEGACNWEDGCGVRSNRQKGTPMAKKKPAKAAANARGNEGDARQIIADLISNDASPFTPDDEDSLRMMSEATLKEMQGQYLTKSEEEPATAEDDEPAVMEDDEPAANEDEVEANEGDDEVDANEGEPEANEEDAEKTAKKRNSKTIILNADQLEKLVSGAVNKALSKHKYAINAATKLAADHRAKLVDRIVANTSMKKKDLASLPLPTLELIANGVHPAPNYAGRALSANADLDFDDSAVKAMLPASTKDFIKSNARKGTH